MTDIQIKLIKAAEIEFAKHGFEGASVRAITSRAGANIASINYHFGSKTDLFREMIRYRIEPINELRLDLLDAAYRETEGGPVPLKRLVEIMVRPLFQTVEREEDALPFMRALGRGLIEEKQFMAQMHQDHLSIVIERFTKAVALSLGVPQPVEPDLFALHFVSCTLVGVMNQIGRAELGNNDESITVNLSAMVDRLVAYITGGILALAEFEKDCASK